MAAPSRNHWCRGKAISITYSECVSVTLVIQHAKRMRRIILSSVAYLVLPHFSTLSHKRYYYRKKVTGHETVFWFSLKVLSETLLILRRIRRDVYRSSCKLPAILSDFNETSILSTDFRKIIQIPNFVKIRPVGAEFPSDGQTDMTKLTAVFAILQKSLKSVGYLSVSAGGLYLSDWVGSNVLKIGTFANDKYNHAFCNMRSLSFPVMGYRICTKLPIGSKLHKAVNHCSKMQELMGWDYSGRGYQHYK
jgi:hypothetical protein